MERSYFQPALATIEVRGSDRVAWLGGLITSDVTKLSATHGSYGLVLSKVGRILTDAYVLLDGERLLVGVSAPVADVIAHFERHLVMEDVDLRDASAEGEWLFVLDASQSPVGAEMPLGLAGSRALWLAGGDATRDLSPFGARLDRAAWDSLRLRSAVPAFGVDFDAKTYPQEAVLEQRAVSFQKGCYLGQEVVCRLQMRGQVHRLLAPFAIDAAAPASGTIVQVDGADVGHVTSATSADGRAVGLAMLKRAFAEPGTKVVIDGREAHVVARG